jgi:hypothetical protein
VRPKRERKAIKMLSLSDKPKNSKKKTKGDPCVTKKGTDGSQGDLVDRKPSPKRKKKLKK